MVLFSNRPSRTYKASRGLQEITLVLKTEYWSEICAGDRIVLIGDYDSSELWQKVEKEKWVEISQQLKEDYNDFAQIDSRKL
jgi:hypothetical protein